MKWDAIFSKLEKTLKVVVGNLLNKNHTGFLFLVKTKNLTSFMVYLKVIQIR